MDSSMNSQNARIAVFIDRDGVINKEVRHPELVDRQGRICTDVLTPEELVFYDGVKEAFRLLHGSHIRAIISNQAGYAKGFVSDEALQSVKRKMQEELVPDGIYYCLHHEDYTGPCDCKKPKKGLLIQAAREHNIDISRSYMVGDRRIDMETGADCKRCFLVNTRDDDVYEQLSRLPPEIFAKVTVVRSLLEAARLIIEDQHPQTKIAEAIIPCAGRGTRMGEMTAEIPKPMIAFDGIPFLHFIIEHLKRQGIRRFIIPVGYLGDVIKEYFGDGSRFGVEIVYVQSSVEVETGGSFKRALAYVHSNAFIMHYGDAFYPYPFDAMAKRFLDSGKTAMFVCQHRPKVEGFEDKNNLVVNDRMEIVAYDRKNASGNATLHDIGITFYTKDIGRYCGPDMFKLDEHVIPLLAAQHQVIAYRTEHNSIGMGSVEKVERFRNYLAEHPEVKPEDRE